MRIITKLMIVGMAAVLAGCSTTAPPPRIAQPARVFEPAPPPYKWTHGNAPQAHKDMVATFGKVGLAPGQYLWAAIVPAEGETKLIIDRLTQMLYAYRGDQLVGAASVSTASKGRVTPLGFWSILEKEKSTARANTTMRRCRSCSGSTNMGSRCTAGTIPAIRRATAASGCR